MGRAGIARRGEGDEDEMSDDRARKVAGSPGTAGIVDYAYLFGCRPTTVRHDPHVRCQVTSVPVDLRAVSLLVRDLRQAR